MMPVHLRDSVIPKHEQLRAILLHKCTKELQPGDLMTSERKLMQDYGVSRITVREAIGQLVNEGHLVRVRGKGTFVAHRPVQSKLHLASFTEEMRAQGHKPTTVVLRSEEDAAPEATAKALRIAPDTSAYHVKRLRLADGEPVSVDDGWFNAALLPGLLDLDLTGSIYRATADKYGMPIDRAEQTVSADGASQEIATLLGIKKGAPVMYFDRVSFSGPTPVEHTRSWYRSDRYQLQMEVQGERAQRSV
ncbi:GntR family transcriptional regulator [Rhodococcus percolatus]|uniref:GntR family transcriptional regulator n=1 Tax=Rhodococcus opacus TaxID=37919 RepID=UPI0015FAA35C|nr:GntR family transcriptional regulator [Rhodococcus opacus]MBA8964823.1 GntR family transcriptional regulator [Rhodococcus opacus]MBP2208375.1 GntR family transcriptional regulator [Rhodococcus opacus]